MKARDIAVAAIAIALTAVAGVIAIAASTQLFWAGLPLLSPLTVVVPLVVRGSGSPVTTMSLLAEITVVPTAAEVIVTVQLAVVAPPE